MTLNNNCYLHLNIRTSLCHKQVPQTRILSIKSIKLFSYSPSYQGCVYRRQKRTYIYIIYIIGGFGFGVTCMLVAREVVTWMLVPGPGVLWTPSHLPPNPPARPGGCHQVLVAWSRSVVNSLITPPPLPPARPERLLPECGCLVQECHEPMKLLPGSGLPGLGVCWTPSPSIPLPPARQGRLLPGCGWPGPGVCWTPSPFPPLLPARPGRRTTRPRISQILRKHR